MNPTLSSPIRSGATFAAFEQLDARLSAWARSCGCDEQRVPVLIAADTLRRAEYPSAFPHLLMAPVVAANPEQPFAEANTQLTNWFLSPAVCYHAYAALAGVILAEGKSFTPRGCCFRHEDPDALAPGRRQVEFEMREVILVGAPAWIEERLSLLKAGVDELAIACGFAEATWQPANDPFFLPRARGKAQMQRLLGTKIELCLPDGLAIASINRHGKFFGDRFGIRLADESPASSACVAFGLDRWAASKLFKL